MTPRELLAWRVCLQEKASWPRLTLAHYPCFPVLLWIHKMLVCIRQAQSFPKWQPAPQSTAANPTYPFLPLEQGCPPVSVETGHFCLFPSFLNYVKHLRQQCQKFDFQPTWRKMRHFSHYVCSGIIRSSKFYYEELLGINPTEVYISTRNLSIPSVLPIQ